MGFVTDALKNMARPLYDPLATLRPSHYKAAAAVTKDTIKYFKAPEAPKPTNAQLFLERAQLEQLSKLNTQENEQRKRLLMGISGPGAYRRTGLFKSEKETAINSIFGNRFSGFGGL
jgi:hypothetical protein